MCECVCVCVWFQTGRNSNPIGKHKFQNISQIYPPLFIIVSLSQSRATVSLTKTTTTIFVYLYPLYLGPSIVTYIGNTLTSKIYPWISSHTYNTEKWHDLQNLAMFGSFIYCILTIKYSLQYSLRSTYKGLLFLKLLHFFLPKVCSLICIHLICI